MNIEMKTAERLSLENSYDQFWVDSVNYSHTRAQLARRHFFNVKKNQKKKSYLSVLRLHFEKTK